MRNLTTLVVLVLLPLSAAMGGDWPSFRGPYGNGFASDSKAPIVWSAEQNILWKTALPRPGNGGPIVSAGRVFVTSAQDEHGRQRSLFCLDAKSGNVLWVRTVEIDEEMPTHETNPYCGSTPVCDGQRVFVWHGSAGLYCYDLQGKKLWVRDLGEFRHMWGYGTSPILYEDSVILHSGPGKRIVLTAVNSATGERIWEQEEPVSGDGEQRDDESPHGSWSTPSMVRVGDQHQLIVVMPTRVNAYHPSTGELIWWCSGLRHKRGDLAYSSAIVSEKLCFVTGGYKGPSMAIRLGGAGDLSESEHLLWRQEENPQSIGTGVIVDGVIYRPNAGPGTIDCIDSETGDILWSDRAVGGNHWSSMVSVGGLLYATNQDGTTSVFRPNKQQFESVAVNTLGEPTNATPAIAGEHIFIRTNQHLVCIGD